MNPIIMILQTLTAISSTIIGTFILAKHPKSRFHQIAFALCWIVAGWIAVEMTSDHYQSQNILKSSLLLRNISKVFTSFMAATIVCFAWYFHQKSPNVNAYRIGLVYLLALTFSVGGFTRYDAQSASIENGKLVIEYGILYRLYTIYFLGCAVYTLGVMIKKWEQAPEQVARYQIKYIAIGLAAALCIGVICSLILPQLGVYEFFFLGTIAPALAVPFWIYALILRISELELDLAAKNQQLEARLREVEAELEDASRIQMSLMPESAPPIEGLELAGKCLPANTVGGDFFDYLPSTRLNEVTIIVADVAGKAMKGAMNAVMTEGILHMAAKAQERPSPASLLEELNDVLQRRTERDMNVTMIIAKIDVQAKNLTLANAGHHAYPILWRGGEIQSLKGSGLPLGMKADLEYNEEQLPLASGDVIIFMTDGIIEAQDSQGKLYSESGRLENTIFQFSRNISVQGIVEAIVSDVMKFSEDKHVASNAPIRNDDMTVVVAKVR